jgi:CRISPR system Cascade subunit CasE
MFISRVRVRRDIRNVSNLHHILRGNGYGAHQMLWDLFPGEQKRAFLFREEIAKEQLPHHRGAKGEPVYYLVSRDVPSKDYPLLSVESKPYTPRLVAGDRLAFRLRANPTIARKVEGKKNSVRHDVVMDAQRNLLHDLAKKIGIPVSGEKSTLKRAIFSAWVQTGSVSIADDLRGVLEENERHREAVEKKLVPTSLLDFALKACADKALEVWLEEKGKGNGFVLVRDDQKDRLKFQAEGYQWHALPKKGKTAGFSSVDFEGEIEVIEPERFAGALFSGIGPAKGFGCGLMLVRRV